MKQSNVAVRVDTKTIKFNTYDDFYNSPEALEILEEAKRLLKDPTAKSFSSTQELINDLLSDEND